MSKNLGKDAGPEGQKTLPKYDGSDDDVEGHQKNMPRDAGPDGQKTLPKYDGGEDDDVEGHKR